MGRLRRLVVRPQALRELTAAYDWYEAQSPGLGSEFLRVAEAAMATLRRSPELYPAVRPAVRRALLRRFPYGLFYASDDEEIIVLAVLHVRQSPSRWPSRP